MVLARRSLIRTATAAQSFRAAPLARLSGPLRPVSNASGKGKEQKSSDLPWPWLLGSIGIGGPVITYLIQSRPEKKPHDGHGAHKGEEEPSTKEKEEFAAEETPSDETERTTEEEEDQGDSGAHGAKPSEAPRMKPPAGEAAKKEELPNTSAMNPYINEPGKSQKGEGETESVKLKGSVKPQRPQE